MQRRMLSTNVSARWFYIGNSRYRNVDIQLADSAEQTVTFKVDYIARGKRLLVM